jgi:hypothetical protein
MKLDQFIEMYLEDRKRLSVLPFPEPKPPPPTPQLAESPSITPTSSIRKPHRSAAGDKTSSEPVSPESVSEAGKNIYLSIFFSICF